MTLDELAKLSDEQSQTELYLRFRKIAYVIGRRYFYKNETDVLDFTHDAAKEAFFAIRGKEVLDVQKFVYQVIRQQAMIAMRERTASKRVGFSVELDAVDHKGLPPVVLVDQAPDPERAAVATKAATTYLRCLPLRDRETLIARYCTETSEKGSRRDRTQVNRVSYLRIKVRKYAESLHGGISA